MIKNIVKFLNTTYKTVNYDGFDNVNPQLVKYFKIEYGNDWQSALTEYLNKKNASNDKKAA